MGERPVATMTASGISIPSVVGRPTILTPGEAPLPGSRRSPPGGPKLKTLTHTQESDLIFFAAETEADLARLADLRAHIKPNGGIWVLRRKGPDASIKDTRLIEAGLAARMVDNKIVAFDEKLSAMRMVIRLMDR